MREKIEQSLHSNLDAYAPQLIAQLVDGIGVKKAHLTWHKLILLGVLAGIFIAFGAMLYTVVITDSQLGYGLTKLIGGVAFSLGLILVVVAGAELFTGNNLIVMAWASGHVATTSLLKNWLFIYLANFLGALFAACAMYYSGLLEENDFLIRETALNIAAGKLATHPIELFIRGVLCNALVCLAIWLCVAAHDVASKVAAIIFPISAFVALGFEHSIANMYFISLAMLHDSFDATLAEGIFHLVPVTLGNIIGGSVLVALVYWLAYLKD